VGGGRRAVLVHRLDGLTGSEEEGEHLVFGEEAAGEGVLFDDVLDAASGRRERGERTKEGRENWRKWEGERVSVGGEQGVRRIGDNGRGRGIGEGRLAERTEED
jgi:hypothetical protein